MSQPRAAEGKVYRSVEQITEVLAPSRPGLRIVFTNGCFDILHVGHVSYLERARDLADILVVGVNSDESARRLSKGPDRPVNQEGDRCRVLAALECVDYVTAFTHDTPRETLAVLRPDIHCKGGDYRPENLPEGDVVASYGGRIVILPFVQGYSTTAILKRAKSQSS